VPVWILVTPSVAAVILVFVYCLMPNYVSLALASGAVFASVVIEGFAVPIALTALYRNGTTRTASNIVATLVGALALFSGVALLVALRGM